MTDDPTTTLAAEHQYQTFSAGDGYRQPREESIGCSCGEEYWSHIEHEDCECFENGVSDQAYEAPQRHAEHLLSVLAEEGWAVVELAERCPDHNTDFYRAPEGWMVETPDYVPGCVAVEGEVMAPADARNLAAALLAAAATAEATS